MFTPFITQGIIRKILFFGIVILMAVPSWAQTTQQNSTNENSKQNSTKQTTTNPTTKQNSSTNKQTPTYQTKKQTTTNPTTKQNTVNPTIKQTPTNQNTKQTTTNQTNKQNINQTATENITKVTSPNQSVEQNKQKENQQVEESRVDTIILVSGKKLLGKVNGVLSSKVTYFPLGKTKMEELARKQIQLIKYSTGRVEKFNKPAYEMVAEGDFKTIILTTKEDEVSGLFKIGKVSAQSSKAARDSKSAEESANIRLQKKAANMGAYIVLITKRESKGGYGEVPTHYVEGIAYALEAPKDQPQQKK